MAAEAGLAGRSGSTFVAQAPSASTVRAGNSVRFILHSPSCNLSDHRAAALKQALRS
jgi:hypothetical protein